MTRGRMEEIRPTFEQGVLEYGYSRSDLVRDGEGYFKGTIDNMWTGFQLAHRVGTRTGSTPLGYVKIRTGEKGDEVTSFSAIPMADHESVGRIIL